MAILNDTSISVALTPAARKMWDDITERSGLKKRIALQKLIEWFCNQDEMVQLLALGFIPESRTESIIEMLHQDLNSRQTPGDDLEESVQSDKGKREGKKSKRKSAS